MTRWRRIRVAAHDSAWAGRFSEAAEALAQAFGAVVAIHHIGSTSVPGLAAKPIIDLCVEIDTLARADAREADVVALGYEALGEHGLPRRRYYRREENGERTHHVHLWAAGDPEVARHLAFRDYLIAHPDVADRYGDLKTALAAQFEWDVDGYIAGKDAFVEDIEVQALRWAGRVGETAHVG